MSRFEKFQNKTVYNEKHMPINEQIIVNGCIINFQNGKINNWYNSLEKIENYPAIDCEDAHMEYWENGILHKDDGPAVVSAGDNIIEHWIDGDKREVYKYYESKRDENFSKGNKGEIIFAEYLNEQNIPFMHIDQIEEKVYSKYFYSKNIKRPDYIVLIKNIPIFIDVKVTSCKTINSSEIEKLINLQNKFSINVILAIIDKNNLEKIEPKYLVINNMVNYIKNFQEKYYSGVAIFDYPVKLLQEELIYLEFDQDKIEAIYKEEKKKNGVKYYFYSDLLFEFIKENNYSYE